MPDELDLENDNASESSEASALPGVAPATPGPQPAEQSPNPASAELVGHAYLATKPDNSVDGWKLGTGTSPDQAESKMRDFLRTHSIAGRSYGEAMDNWGRYFEGIDKPSAEQYQQFLDRAPEEHLLDVTRRQAAIDQPTTSGATIPLAAFGRDIPRAAMYAESLRRFQGGTATGEDYGTIAHYELEQQRRGEFAQQHPWANLGMQLPGMAQQFRMVGGIGAGMGIAGQAALQTAALPTMWLPQAMVSNAEQGRDPLDIKGIGQEFAPAFLQMVTLGAIAKVTGATLPFQDSVAGRAIAQGLGFPIGQQLTDFMGYAVGLKTRYGALNDLVDGKRGEFAQQIAQEIFTGAAFSLMHGNEQGGKDKVNRFVELLNEAADSEASGSGTEFPGGPGPSGAGGGQRSSAGSAAGKAADQMAREILNVKVGATPEEVAAAWRQAAGKHHPDRGGDPVNFQWVDWAKSVLMPQQGGRAARTGRPGEPFDPNRTGGAEPGPSPGETPPEAAKAAPDETPARPPESPVDASEPPPAPDVGKTAPEAAPATVEAAAQESSDLMGAHESRTPGGEALLTELRGSPHAAEVAAAVPKGSTPIGEPNQAFVFRTPEGEIIRVAKAGERADVPEMLQATETKRIGDWQVERLPEVEKVGDREVFRKYAKQLRDALRSQGYHPSDLHPGNVGMYKGKPVIIDPAAVVKFPNAETAARYKPAEAPLEQRVNEAKTALYDAENKLTDAKAREKRELGNKTMKLRHEYDAAKSDRLAIERTIDGTAKEPGLRRKLADLRDAIHVRDASQEAPARSVSMLDRIRATQTGAGRPIPPPTLRPLGPTSTTPGRGAAKDLLRRAGAEAAALRMRQAARGPELPPPAERAAAAESKDWRERVLGYRADRFQTRIKAALSRPTPENVGHVAESVERLARMAISRGMDPAQTIHDNLPELDKFLAMIEEKPELLPPNEEERNAIAAVFEAAKSQSVEPASVRRGIGLALRGQNPSAGPAQPGQEAAGAQEGSGSASPAGVPQAAGSELGRPADQFGRSLFDVAKEFVQGEAGQLNLPLNRAAMKQAVDQVRRAIHYTMDAFKRVSGRMLPSTTRMDRKAGESMARWAVAKEWAQRAADYYTDLTLGEGASDDADAIAGAVITERRLRYMRKVYQDKADALRDDSSRLFGDAAAEKQREADKYQKIADGVETVIGKPGSPLPDFNAYKRVLGSPRMQKILADRRKHFVPIMEDNLRKSQGMEDTDPIEAETQIPGDPMNLKAMQGGETPNKTTVFTRGAGNLKNLRMGKFPFKQQATGSAEAYDISYRAIIAHSLEKGYPVAARAVAYRDLHEAGLLKWGNRGQAKTFDDKPGIFFPDAKPPKGTQSAAATDDGAYVHPDVAGEFRAVLAIDPVESYQKVLATINALPTIAALASSVEATTHGTNLFLSAFAPGVRPNDLQRNAYDRLAGSMEFRKKLLNLAKIGAIKPPGMESGSMFGPMNKLANFVNGADLPEGLKRADPTYWGGKYLDAMSDIMRVTLADAYRRLAQKGLVPSTETGLRDFVNQWAGQYNKKAQNGMVRFLRNTGIGPFATASTTMTSRAVRSLLGGSGTTGTSMAADIGLRAITLGKMAAMWAAAFALNYAAWGRWDGDDNTPVGAIKLGTDSHTGKTIFVDTPVSMVRRGLRALGLLAAIEQGRKGAPPGVVADKMVDQAWRSLIAPAMGPGVQFAYTARTGENLYGTRLAEHAEKGEGGQTWLNMKAALANANPAVAALTGADEPPGNLHSASDLERWSKLLGPLGPKFRGESRREAASKAHH